MPGLALGDVWTDISPINSQARERLGYPTQPWYYLGLLGLAAVLAEAVTMSTLTSPTARKVMVVIAAILLATGIPSSWARLSAWLPFSAVATPRT